MQFDAQDPDRTIVLVHHEDARGIWATRGRSIFHAELHVPIGTEERGGAEGRAGPWRKIGSFPASPPVDLALGRVARRLLRSEKCNVYPTRSNKLFGIRQGVAYRLDDGGATALFEIQGDCVMNRAIAEDATGYLFFGEYFGNPQRGSVRIFKVAPDLESYEVAYSFEAGRTRHIHAVHVDPFDPGRLWVTMGDFPGECFLAYTDDSFETLHMLGDGSQLWRMVGIVFRENRLCWLTDSHVEQNHVVSMDRAASEPVIHGDRDASSWFVAETSEGLYLATTCVEPGAGIHTRDVSLLASEDGTDWEPVAAYAKDWLPMKLGFGSLSLPSGHFSKSRFWISGEAIEGLDGRSQRCEIR